MARPIDADGFLDRNAEFANREFIHPKYQVTLRELVDSEPTLSPDDVRGVGKWIWHDNYGWDDSLECSCCAKEFVVYDGEFPGINSFKFCPNCGARMKGASEDA